MFERFTLDARQAIVFAQEEGRHLNHHHCGTEHLLLGLLADPDSIPGQALAGFGVDAATARNVVGATVARDEHPTIGQLPFTRSAKKALELGLRNALEMGQGAWIEPGHILLGLLDVGESPGLTVLEDFGVTIDALRADVRSRLASTERAQRRVRAVAAATAARATGDRDGREEPRREAG